jgi:hypothetical protein
MSEHWEIVQALTWLALGAPMSVEQLVAKETEELKALSGPMLALTQCDLDTERVCAAARDDALKIVGRQGRGLLKHGGLYHADFGTPELIPPAAFINAEIRYYNPPHLFHPQSSPPVWYHLAVDIAKFKTWARRPLEEKAQGGAPYAADWPALEEELQREIAAVGFPSKDHEPGWRRPADVIRWVEKRTGKDEPGRTSLKVNVNRMLENIRSNLAGNQ